MCEAKANLLEDLKNTINQLDLTDIYRKCHSNVSIAHTLSKKTGTLCSEL